MRRDAPTPRPSAATLSFISRREQIVTLAARYRVAGDLRIRGSVAERAA